MQVRTLLQTDNHTSIPPLSFLQARYPSCHPTNSIKALNETQNTDPNNCLMILVQLRPLFTQHQILPLHWLSDAWTSRNGKLCKCNQSIDPITQINGQQVTIIVLWMVLGFN